MEYRDLYDENRVLTREKIEKHDPVPAGRYYVTVMVFMENSKGEILLQQRSAAKGGQWATAGGHPKSGETSLVGMRTEIEEEIGVCVLDDELTLFKTIQTEDDFVDFYYLKKDILVEEIKMQDEEVQNVKWFSKEKVEEMILDGTFFKWHVQPYRWFLEYINK